MPVRDLPTSELEEMIPESTDAIVELAHRDERPILPIEYYDDGIDYVDNQFFDYGEVDY